MTQKRAHQEPGRVSLHSGQGTKRSKRKTALLLREARPHLRNKGRKMKNRGLEGGVRRGEKAITKWTAAAEGGGKEKNEECRRNSYLGLWKKRFSKEKKGIPK